MKKRERKGESEMMSEWNKERAIEISTEKKQIIGDKIESRERVRERMREKEIERDRQRKR